MSAPDRGAEWSTYSGSIVMRTTSPLFEPGQVSGLGDLLLPADMASPVLSITQPHSDPPVLSSAHSPSGATPDPSPTDEDSGTLPPRLRHDVAPAPQPQLVATPPTAGEDPLGMSALFRQSCNPELFAVKQLKDRFNMRRPQSSDPNQEASTPTRPQTPSARATTALPGPRAVRTHGAAPAEDGSSPRAPPLSEYEWGRVSHERGAARRQRSRERLAELQSIEQQIGTRLQQQHSRAMQAHFLATAAGGAPRRHIPAVTSPRAGQPLPRSSTALQGGTEARRGQPDGPWLALPPAADCWGDRDAVLRRLSRSHPRSVRYLLPALGGGRRGTPRRSISPARRGSVAGNSATASCVTSRKGVARVRDRAAQQAAVRVRRARGRSERPWLAPPLPASQPAPRGARAPQPAG
eukprot:TRINITY_DN25051_c0_g1_i1.p1 TRINITY_DN25051_c0_g1~~TRINITY_DN25051_c0_g1_i1.p1  ORF type:complete len:408 (+),score=62.41 TRINITY_DN25051_c0_g1_i1:276-1499(+)